MRTREVFYHLLSHAYFMKPTQLLHHPGLFEYWQVCYVIQSNDLQQQLQFNTPGWNARTKQGVQCYIAILVAISGRRFEPPPSVPWLVTLPLRHEAPTLIMEVMQLFFIKNVYLVFSIIFQLFNYYFNYFFTKWST